MKTYYDLLEVAPGAPADVVKRAFRREIAKYHPDKVQHLGREFQEIAASKAAELTQAYKTLSDAAARAEYDAALAGAAADAPAQHTAAQPPAPPAAGARFASERDGASALMKRAALARFEAALSAEFGEWAQPRVSGFDVAALPAQRFWSLRPPPGVLGRIVETVDGAAVAETWGLALRWKKDGARDLCVFLMGASLASAGELAAAIAEQRRKPGPAGLRLVLLPVNTGDWTAHVPTDAPDAAKSLLSRLRAR